MNSEYSPSAILLIVIAFSIDSQGTVDAAMRLAKSTARSCFVPVLKQTG